MSLSLNLGSCRETFHGPAQFLPSAWLLLARAASGDLYDLGPGAEPWRAGGISPGTAGGLGDWLKPGNCLRAAGEPGLEGSLLQLWKAGRVGKLAHALS